MAEFDYEATDIDGRPTSGRLTADDADAAARQLEALGWTVIAVRPTPTPAEPPMLTEMDLEPEQPEDPQQPSAPRSDPKSMGRMSRGEALEVAGHLADLSAAGMPLASGLSALSLETPDRRIRRHLQSLSARIRDGADLADTLTGPGVPADLRAMVRVGLRMGRLGTVLSQYVQHTRRSVGLRRQTLTSLWYVGLITAFALAFWLLYLVWLVPMFRNVFDDFGTELPAVTEGILNLSWFLVTYGWTVPLGLAVIALGVWSVSRWLFSPAKRRRMLYAIPVIGPAVRSAAVSRFARLLGMLIGGGVPLPEALRLAGEASADPELAEASDELAEMLASGATLDPVAWPERRLPASLVQLLSTTGRQAVLPEALETSADIYEAKALSRAMLLGPMVEPFIIFAVAFSALWLIGAMFAPLVKLLNDLS